MSRTFGNPNGGKPPLTSPTTAIPRAGRSTTAATTSPSPSTAREGGATTGREPLHGQRDDQQPRAQNHRRAVRVAELRDDLTDDREEIARRDANTQELAELGCDHDQRDAVDIPEQHRLAEEICQEPQPENARQRRAARPSRAPARLPGRDSAPDRLCRRPSRSERPSPPSEPPRWSQARSRAAATSPEGRTPPAVGRCRRARRRPAVRPTRPSPATREPRRHRPSRRQQGRSARKRAGSEAASPVPVPRRPPAAGRARGARSR